MLKKELTLVKLLAKASEEKNLYGTEEELFKKLKKSISSKSKLSEKDALKLGRKINKSLHQKYT
ncbi:hypothetical protein CMO89_03415 [Candidatus Woesearchaeota archaeon]|nr:hypothetical protein [Candidatus Woesearchaeota archaeon]|tara:strand:- start:9338 stop:9529 length:192 start_codon:yes stop_codon:yes gene_type:complete